MKVKMKPSNKNQTNQKGLVAIVVTMIIIIVISLVVIGFARLTRRSQVQTLDRQLNSQALYAAETGVNDAIEFLKTNPTASGSTCNGNASDFTVVAGLTTKKVLEPNVEYTCLLVDPAPTTLTYQNVEPFEYKVVPVKSQSGAPINNLTIAWENPNQSSEGEKASCTATHPEFTTRDVWTNNGGNPRCNHPVLRIDIIAESNTTTIPNLRNPNNTATLFAYPSPGPSTLTSFVSANGANQGFKPSARCTANEGKCVLTISGLGANSYFLRLASIYYAATIDVSAGSLGLVGAQALVDSTGKAQDVLKRVQVRVPLGSFNRAPFFAIQSGNNLCKLLSVNADDASNTTNPTDCPFN